MSALEQSFADLCAKHDVHYVDVGINLKQRPAARFRASVQWDGDDGCASSNGATISEALTGAISAMLVKRGLRTDALADDPLPVEAV